MYKAIYDASIPFRKFHSQEKKKEMIILRRKGLTLEKIGKLYNICRERVRQIIGNTGTLVLYPDGYKRCYMCKKVLPTTHFYVMKNENNSHRCKACMKILSRKWSNIYHYKYNKGGKYHKNSLARVAVANAIKNKQIIKPSVCLINNECSGRIEAHHYLGYEREHWLDIQWFCSKHHHMIDNGIIKI